LSPTYAAEFKHYVLTIVLFHWMQPNFIVLERRRAPGHRAILEVITNFFALLVHAVSLILSVSDHASEGAIDIFGINLDV